MQNLNLAPLSSPTRTWWIAATILMVQVVFCGALLLINLVAEQAAGRQVSVVTFASPTPDTMQSGAGGVYRPIALNADQCCSAPQVTVHTLLTASDARLTDPALLIVSAHDNAFVFVGGERVGGQGRLGALPSNLSGRPILVHIPGRLAKPGAAVDIVVSRAVGTAHLRPFNIGEYDDLYPSFLALRLLRSDLPFINAALAAWLAAFCFFAAPLFGQRGLLFSLSGLCASWAAQNVGLLVSDPPWGRVANHGVYYGAFLATLMFTVWFLVEWTSVFAAADPPSRRGWRRLLSLLINPWSARARRLLALISLPVIAVGAVLIGLRLTGDLASAAHEINFPISWLGLVVAPLCLVRIAAFYARAGLRHPIESSAFLFVIVAALADMIDIRFFHGSGLFLNAAVTFFPLALLVSLAVRARGVFEAAAANTDKLNSLVTEREREVRAGLEALRRSEREAMLLEERSRITSDIHDGIGGQLRGLIVRARSGKLAGQTLVAGLEESLNDLRLVVESLEQGEASLPNVIGAFRSRIEPRCDAAGVELDWRIEDIEPAPVLGPSHTLQIYRILQEAGANALAHGKPGRLQVGLRRNADGAVEIWIEDDGAGFDPGAVKPGRGLANMRLRAGRLGAELTVAGLAKGTRITLTLAPDTRPDQQG